MLVLSPELISLFELCGVFELFVVCELFASNGIDVNLKNGLVCSVLFLFDLF